MNTGLVELQKAMMAEHKTARELAKKCKCSIPTVYRRIFALKQHGAIISEMTEPGKKTGPAPVRYQVVREANL